MALSPDGNVLALDQSDRLRLMNVNTGRGIASVSLFLPLVVRRWINEMHWPSGAIAFSADGQWLALRTGREVSILRGSYGRRICQIKLEPENSGRAVPRSLAFSLDGRWLAMGDYGENLQVWQLPRRLSLF